MNGHPPTPARRRLASLIGDARILGLSEGRERSLVDCSGDENALAALRREFEELETQVKHALERLDFLQKRLAK